jgi:hypothetical protein
MGERLQFVARRLPDPDFGKRAGLFRSFINVDVRG